MMANEKFSTLRVAHFLDGQNFGGAEQIVRRLIQAAPATGVEAWAYCLREGRLAAFLRNEGARARVFGSRGKFDWRVIGAVASAAREDQIQILQAHTSRTHLLARFLSSRLNIPNITTIHSPIAQDENRSARLHPLRAWVERLGRPWTHHIVTVSREEGERIIREEGVAPDKLTWIPNGVSPAGKTDRAVAREALNAALRERRLDPQPFVAAMIAQMRPRKGPEVLLKGFARWRKEGGRGALLMIGDDEFTQGAGYLDLLKSLSKLLGIAEAVWFTGFMEDPWRLARGADVVALPSLFGEGMPLVLLEAMSHAIPIAVSDTPGNRELAGEGRHGWLHPAGDDVMLARQLGEAARDPEAARLKGNEGRRHFMEHYTLEHVAGRYRELYDKLSQNRPLIPKGD